MATTETIHYTCQIENGVLGTGYLIIELARSKADPFNKGGRGTSMIRNVKRKNGDFL